LTAFIAKFAARLVCFSTFWAYKFQFLSAFIAEDGVFRILMLAVWTFHFSLERLEINF